MITVSLVLLIAVSILPHNSQLAKSQNIASDVAVAMSGGADGSGLERHHI